MAIWWGLQGSSSRPVAQQTSNAADAVPTVELRGSRLAHYDSQGRLLWVIISEALRYEKEVEQTTAQDVQVQFFTVDHPALQLRADQLIFFQRSGDMALRGAVVGRDEKEGLRFQTEMAHWSDREGVLRGEVPLGIAREDLALQGAGFSYWPSEDKLLVQSAQLRFRPGRR